MITSVYLDDTKLAYSSDIINDSTHAFGQFTLDDELSKSSVMKFQMFPGHLYYDDVECLKTFVKVIADDAVVFIGRVIEVETDIWGQRSIECESCVGFLADSIQPIVKTDKGKVKLAPAEAFERLITEHNSQVEDRKKFKIGTVDMADLTTKVEYNFSSFANTRSMIEDQMLKNKNSYLVARYESDGIYLDVVSNFGRTSEQPVEVGYNIVNFTHTVSTDDMFTRLIPVGKNNLMLSDDPTVTDKSIYIQNDGLVAKYGVITVVKTFDEIQYATKLREAAWEYMNKMCTGLPVEMEISAIDMSLIGLSSDTIKLGDKVRVRSELHNVDKEYTCTKISRDYMNPENTKFTIGDEEKQDEFDQSGYSAGAMKLSDILNQEYQGVVERQGSLYFKIGDRFEVFGANLVLLEGSLMEFISNKLKVYTDQLLISTQTASSTAELQSWYTSIAPFYTTGTSYKKGDFVLRDEGTVEDSDGNKVSKYTIYQVTKDVDKSDNTDWEATKANFASTEYADLSVIKEHAGKLELKIDSAMKTALEAKADRVYIQGQEITIKGVQSELDKLRSETSIALEADKISLNALETKVNGKLSADELFATEATIGKLTTTLLNLDRVSLTKLSTSSGADIAGHLRAGSITVGNDDYVVTDSLFNTKLKAYMDAHPEHFKAGGWAAGLASAKLLQNDGQAPSTILEPGTSQTLNVWALATPDATDETAIGSEVTIKAPLGSVLFSSEGNYLVATHTVNNIGYQVNRVMFSNTSPSYKSDTNEYSTTFLIGPAQTPVASLPVTIDASAAYNKGLESKVIDSNSVSIRVVTSGGSAYGKGGFSVKLTGKYSDGTEFAFGPMECDGSGSFVSELYDFAYWRGYNEGYDKGYNQ